VATGFNNKKAPQTILLFHNNARRIGRGKTVGILIDFLSIFRPFSGILQGQVVRLNLKVQFFYCSILIVQAMFCENLKLDFTVYQPQLFPKVELCWKSTKNS
jgi:hypothetical protein